MRARPVRPAALRRAPRGVTLAECLISLAIAGGVGLASAAMLASVSTTLDVSDAGRTTRVDRQAVIMQLGRLTRGTSGELARDGSDLLLWKGDTDFSGVPELGELRLLRFDDASGEVWVFESPTPLPPGGPATPFDSDDDALAQVQPWVHTAHFPGRLVASGVGSWSVHDSGDAVTLTLGAGSGSDGGEPHHAAPSITIVSSAAQALEGGAP